MSSRQSSVNDIIDAIILHQQNGLRFMRTEQIVHLPKKYLSTCASHELAWNFARLPLHLKNDKSLQKYRFCIEHWTSDGDQIDGPPPPRYKCCKCIQNKVLLEEDDEEHNHPII